MARAFAEIAFNPAVRDVHPAARATSSLVIGPTPTIARWIAGGEFGDCRVHELVQRRLTDCLFVERRGSVPSEKTPGTTADCRACERVRDRPERVRTGQQ